MPEVPIELQIPLPTSRSCSDDGRDDQNKTETDDTVERPKPLDVETGLEREALPELPEIPNEKPTGEDTLEKNSRGGPPASLDALARLVELERFEALRWVSGWNNLNQLSSIFGLDRRLLRISSLAYRNMMDCFKMNDQAGFAASYQAYETLSLECHTSRVPEVHDPPESIAKAATEAWECPQNSWLGKMPSDVQQDILGFLVNLRTEPDFFAERISSLSASELTALTSSYQRVAFADSVFQNRSQSKVRSFGKDSRSGSIASGPDTSHGLHICDPYHVLLYCVFDDSSKPQSDEYRLRSEAWSTACARVLSEGRRGSDELALTTLDAFARLQKSTFKPRLELFLMKLLHDGAFLLDSPQAADFTQPVEMHNAQAAVAISRFFDQALEELFQLLLDEPSRPGIPKNALDFARAILTKINDLRTRLKAKAFIVSRWFFQSFLSNIIVYPEVNRRPILGFQLF